MFKYGIPIFAAFVLTFAGVAIIKSKPVRASVPPPSTPPAAGFASKVGAVGLVEAASENIGISLPVSGLVTHVLVKAGDTVVALTQAAMRDPAIFPEPDTLRPDRPRASYLHYGGGLHPCAGRAINDFQITTLVAKLLDRGFESTGPVIWAGPFPDELSVHFTRRQG